MPQLFISNYMFASILATCKSTNIVMTLKEMFTGINLANAGLFYDIKKHNGKFIFVVFIRLKYKTMGKAMVYGNSCNQSKQYNICLFVNGI